ncbi:10738_t:CDS:2 [Acaulospora colombiana]|uniref:10738_t:CDS:1 n=1 Tax=Acaulospora colombiana TaxID=27376 RepID=A0ACA9JXL1_9GLOM|nr:10738_t:CDS:2 [Acaulospora colombiana]
MTRLSETVCDIIELLDADIAHGKSGMLSISGEESITGGAGSTSRMQESNKIMLLSSSDDNRFAEVFSSVNTILMNLMANVNMSGLLGAMLVLLFASNIYSFIYSGNVNKFQKCDSPLPTKVIHTIPSVYLRDLEEQVFNMSSGKVLHSVVDPESQFLDTRTQYPPYPWLLHSNRQLSEEINYARKRVAVIRYNLLSTFRQINSIDKILIENEYVNWLLDERAKCNKAKWMFLKDDALDEEKSVTGDNDVETRKVGGEAYIDGSDEDRDDTNEATPLHQDQPNGCTIIPYEHALHEHAIHEHSSPIAESENSISTSGFSTNQFSDSNSTIQSPDDVPTVEPCDAFIGPGNDSLHNDTTLVGAVALSETTKSSTHIHSIIIKKARPFRLFFEENCKMLLSLKTQLAVESHRAELSTSPTSCIFDLAQSEKIVFHLLLALSLALLVYAAIEPQIRGESDTIVINLMDYNYNPLY